MQWEKRILFTGIWSVSVFVQFSNRVRHTYAFIFKDVVKNSIGLYVVLYVSGLILERTFDSKAVVQQEEDWSWMQKTLFQISALPLC